MRFKLLNYRTKSSLKGNKTPRYNLSYKKAVTIGVVFSVEDKAKHEAVKEFIRKLEHDGKQVKVVAYLPPDRENYDFLFDIFTKREISFWGNITASNALIFADTPFDFLIYLDASPNPLILNLIANSKAKCRVGKFWSDGAPFFEMMIEGDGNTRTFIEHVYQYTSAIK